MARPFDKMFEAAECDRALSKIAQGKLDAVAVIYKYMQRQIYAVCYSVLHDFSLAEDATQDTFIKIIERASAYKSGTSAKAWMLTVARNVSLDMVRHRKFETADENIDDDISERFDEGAVITSLEVKSALETLDEDDRQIITMKVYSGLRHSEIAQIMGITTEAAKKKYQRAVAKMKELL